jgi:hypothetical protein
VPAPTAEGLRADPRYISGVAIAQELTAST